MPETLGRYELIAEIGKGGMADVQLAVQRGASGFEKLVVLKLLHEELANDPQTVEMLIDEAKLATQIKHPNVIEVYELGEADGKRFIAMEYLEGEPLLAILDKSATATPGDNKRLDPLSFARIVADTAGALDAAHARKIVHHDVSLGNIFVLYSGQVKLLDFGVAKAAKKTGKIFGKLPYMAPEKLDEKPGDARSDIWSLGVVLWETLALKRLFKGASDTEILREVRYVNVPPPSSVNTGVPKELDAIALKALQRDPSRRYQTAKDFAIALDEVLTAKSYPSKNYKIGTFMMATFADHIAARERLLREATGPNRPSAEVIEAAFDKEPAKRESLPSIDDLLEPENVVMLPEGSTGADAMLAASAPNPFEPEDVAETVYDVVPANAEASRALRYEADPSWNRSKHGERLKELQKKAQEARDNPGAARRRQLIPYAIGGGVALLIVMIVAIKACGGDKKTVAPVAKSADPPVMIDAAVPKSVAVDATPTVAVAIDAAPVADEEIEMPPEEATEPKEDPKPDRPKPTKSAQRLYAEGLTAWKKNNVRAAYELWTEGRRANSRYANNWYGLGLVHDKAGRKKDARTAYERYMQLAPNAPNNKKLRDHIKKNLM